jgi:hypothetical protein
LSRSMRLSEDSQVAEPFFQTIGDEAGPRGKPFQERSAGRALSPKAPSNGAAGSEIGALPGGLRVGGPGLRANMKLKRLTG